MKLAADTVLLALSVLAFVPVAVLLVEVLFALVPQRPAPPSPRHRPRLAVLVPAHNESAGILDTLNSVLPQLAHGDRLVVVADNCSDDTAQVARSAGADVVERHDSILRGKGYALDFGVRHLARDLPGNVPDVVIVVDADCLVVSGTLDRIAGLSIGTGRPVQAMYLMKSPASAGAMGALAEFAWIVKNKVRPLGTHGLGMPCHLMGTGMAFPWPALRVVELATGHIVEDMAMGLAFARAGTPALYCPEALVTSSFPVNDEGSKSQRKRWEHGHMSVILEETPRLFFDGLKRMDAGLLVLALDTCVPPLALLALTVLALMALSAVNALVGGSPVPLAAACIVALMFALAVGISWWRFGREAVTFGGLVHVLAYVLRKIPLYLAFAIRREKQWIRSKRDDS